MEQTLIFESFENESLYCAVPGLYMCNYMYRMWACVVMFECLFTEVVNFNIC